MSDDIALTAPTAVLPEATPDEEAKSRRDKAAFPALSGRRLSSRLRGGLPLLLLMFFNYLLEMKVRCFAWDLFR